MAVPPYTLPEGASVTPAFEYQKGARVRFPSVNAVIFGFRTWSLNSMDYGSTDPVRGTSSLSGNLLNVFNDILSCDMSGSLSEHTGTFRLLLRDRPGHDLTLAVDPAGGAVKYPDPVSMVASNKRTQFIFEDSLYLNSILPNQLVMIRMFGNVLSRVEEEEGNIPLPGGGSRGQDLETARGDLPGEMDFVGTIDSVKRVRSIESGSVSKSIEITGRLCASVLIDDKVTSYPFNGLVATDSMDSNPVLIADVSGVNTGIPRSWMLLQRVLGKAYGIYGPQSDFSNNTGSDGGASQGTADTFFDFYQSSFGAPVGKIIELLMRHAPSMNTVLNYSTNGRDKYNVLLRPFVPTGSFDAGQTYGTEADLVTGLITHQIDGNIDLSGQGSNLFGTTAFPSGAIPAGTYSRIYSQLLTGQGSVMSLIENVINRPWVEMFTETVGRRNVLVVRTPPFDYEDIVSTWNQQRSLRRITEDMYLSDTLSVSDDNVQTFFRVDPEGPISANWSLYSVQWAALLELVDRYGVREFHRKVQLLNWGDLAGANIVDAVAKSIYDNNTSPHSAAPVIDTETARQLDAFRSTEDGARTVTALEDMFAGLQLYRDRAVRWMAPNAVFRSGTITMRCPRIPIRSGTWITLEPTKELFYIESWKKHAQRGNPSTATLTVSRGYHRQGYYHVCRRSNRKDFSQQAYESSPLTEFAFSEWARFVYPNIVSVINRGQHALYDDEGNVPADVFAAQ